MFFINLKELKKSKNKKERTEILSSKSPRIIQIKTRTDQERQNAHQDLQPKTCLQENSPETILQSVKNPETSVRPASSPEIPLPHNCPAGKTMQANVPSLFHPSKINMSSTPIKQTIKEDRDHRKGKLSFLTTNM